MVALTIRARAWPPHGEPGDDAHAALACGAELHIYQGMPERRGTPAGLAQRSAVTRRCPPSEKAAAPSATTDTSGPLKIWDAGYQASVTALREAI